MRLPIVQVLRVSWCIGLPEMTYFLSFFAGNVSKVHLKVDTILNCPRAGIHPRTICSGLERDLLMEVASICILTRAFFMISRVYGVLLALDGKRWNDNMIKLGVCYTPRW